MALKAKRGKKKAKRPTLWFFALLFFVLLAVGLGFGSLFVHWWGVDVEREVVIGDRQVDLHGEYRFAPNFLEFTEKNGTAVTCRTGGSTYHRDYRQQFPHYFDLDSNVQTFQNVTGAQGPPTTLVYYKRDTCARHYAAEATVSSWVQGTMALSWLFFLAAVTFAVVGFARRAFESSHLAIIAVGIAMMLSILPWAIFMIAFPPAFQDDFTVTPKEHIIDRETYDRYPDYYLRSNETFLGRFNGSDVLRQDIALELQDQCSEVDGQTRCEAGNPRDITHYREHGDATFRFWCTQEGPLPMWSDCRKVESERPVAEGKGTSDHVKLHARPLMGWFIALGASASAIVAFSIAVRHRYKTVKPRARKKRKEVAVAPEAEAGRVQPRTTRAPGPGEPGGPPL